MPRASGSSRQRLKTVVGESKLYFGAFLGPLRSGLDRFLHSLSVAMSSPQQGATGAAASVPVSLAQSPTRGQRPSLEEVIRQVVGGSTRTRPIDRKTIARTKQTRGRPLTVPVVLHALPSPAGLPKSRTATQPAATQVDTDLSLVPRIRFALRPNVTTAIGPCVKRGSHRTLGRLGPATEVVRTVCWASAPLS